MAKHSGRSQAKVVMKNVQEKLMNTAFRRLREQLPTIMGAANDYARDEQTFGDMTGNWINSFGVALYRDGKCVAVANMSGEEDAPIRTTLINDEAFPAGHHRFDGSVQQMTFEVGLSPEKMGSSRNYFANEEVLQWLSHSSTRQKGFSFRVVSVTEYHKQEARNALFRLSDEMESRGGNIWHFHM